MLPMLSRSKILRPQARMWLAVLTIGSLIALLAHLLAPRPSPVEAQPAAQPPLCFPQTGFCVENPAFRAYFLARGGERILGYPVSRELTLDGFTVQIFQRVVLQLQDGEVHRLNVLDESVMPMRRANGSAFPVPEPRLAAAAPAPGIADYGTQVDSFLEQVVPDVWDGEPVAFLKHFRSTIPTDGQSELSTLLNLEIWGLPTSYPERDPNNPAFIYQRFQRGIMHYRADCRCTDGVLVGDHFKSVLSGRNLPPDLAEDLQGSRYLGLMAPDTPAAVAFVPAEDLAPASSVSTASSTGTPFNGPILISTGNFLQYCDTYRGYGPFIVRSPIMELSRFQFEIDSIAKVGQVCDSSEIQEFSVGFGSLEDMKRSLTPANVTRMKDLGVKTISYNPEVTPRSSMEERQAREFMLRDASDSNSLLQFVDLATVHDFKAAWAPLRDDADRIDPAVLERAAQKGLDMLYLQEQLRLERSCPVERAAAVRATAENYRRIFRDSLSINVQIMSGKENPPSRCFLADAYANDQCPLAGTGRFPACTTFVSQLTQSGLIDVVSIWPIGNELDLIRAIRGR